MDERIASLVSGLILAAAGLAAFIALAELLY